MATLTISLPNQLAQQIDQATKAGGFATRSEFFRALLRKHFSSPEFEVFTPRPLSEIKANLKKTGKYNQKFIDSVIKGLAESSVYAN
jgi:Arc/MetJ-type ribon-helix-helix transcriptional regulator